MSDCPACGLNCGDTCYDSHKEVLSPDEEIIAQLERDLKKYKDFQELLN